MHLNQLFCLAAAKVPGTGILGRAQGFSVLFCSDYLRQRDRYYLAHPGLAWTNAAMDGLIAGACIVVFACLFWVVRRLRHILVFQRYVWMLASFGMFLLACGATYLMEFATVWWPPSWWLLYPLSTALKVICAGASIPAAILLARAAPDLAGGVRRFLDKILLTGAEDEQAGANYRTQFEAIDRSQMIAEFTTDGAIVKTNANYLRAFGYKDGELDGKHHSIFVTEEFRKSAEYAEFWTGLKSGSFQSGLFKRVARDGREVWIEASYNPVIALDGTTLKVLKFASDVSQRMKFQSQFVAAESRLQAIVDNVLDGILTINAAGVIVSLNPATVAMFGYPASDVVGQNVRMLLPGIPGRDDGYPGFSESAGGTTAIGVVRELEGRTKGGQAFPIEFTITHASVHGQRLFIAVIRDTTELKRAEMERIRQVEALRTSEAFLDRTGKLAAVGGWEVDLLTSEVTWSAEAARIHGMDANYLPTLDEAINFFAPEARPILRTAMETALSDGKTWELDLPLIRADGRRIWARLIGSAEFVDGKPVRHIGAIKDVTSRVAAQLALQEANARAALATESIGDVFTALDLDLRYTYWNSHAAETFGVAVEDAIGKTRFEVFGQSEHAANADILCREAMRIGQPMQHETRFVIGLETHFYELRVFPDHNGITCISRNVTERRRAEEERGRQERALRVSEDFLDRTGRLAGVGGWEVDLLSGEVTWSAETHRLHAVPAGYLPTLEQGIDFYPPAARPVLLAALEKAVSDGQTWELQLPLIRADGVEILARVVGSAEFVDGKPVRHIGAIQDVTARVAEQLALEEANTRATLATESIDDIFTALDSDLRFTYWNRRAEETFGIKAEVALGKTRADLHGETEYGTRADSLCRGVIESGQPTHYETVFGTAKQIYEVRVFPTMGGVTCISRNITALRQAEEARSRQEEALRTSEDFLDRTGKLAGVGGWELDLRTQEVNWSAQTCRIHGVEVGFRPTFEQGLNFFAPAARPLLQAALEKAASDGQTWELQLPLIRADGEEMLARVVGSAEFVDGRPVRHIGAIQDVTVRVAEHLALQEANTRAALATESIEDIFTSLDHDLRFTYWNGRATEALGIQPEMALGKTRTELYGETVFGKRADDFCREAMRTRKPMLYETPFGAENHIYEVRVFPTVGGIACISRNVTERKRMEEERSRQEEAIRNSNALFEAFMDNIPMIGFIKDEAGHLIYYNGLFAERFDIARDEWIGKDDFEIWPEDFAKAYHACDQAVLASGKLVITEEESPGPGDATFYWRTYKFPVVNASGEKLLAAMSIEISFEKLAEAARVVEEVALKEANTRASLAAESGGIGIWDWDIVNNKMVWDSWMYRLYGMEASDDVWGTYEVWRRHLHPDDLAAGIQAVQDGVDGIKPYNFEFRVIWKDGSIHHLKATATVTRDDTGRALRMVGTNWDITERKQSEDASRQAQLAAESSNQTKSDFLANMSHEIRTPMNAILGMTHLALRANPAPGQLAYLLKIDKAAQSLLSIINDILDFSKVEAGKLQLERIPFSLQEVLNDLNDIVVHRAKQKDIALDFVVSPEIPPFLIGDPLRLRQILINLVDNAIKFTSEGQVTLRVVAENVASDVASITFSVRDSGIGMTSEQISNLFKSFHQADTSVTRKYGGTGLGLAITKQLCELLGGDLTVVSKPGKGSTFSFTIVFSVALEGPLAVARARLSDVVEKKVLVVDDTEAAREVLVAMLDTNGFVALAVASGREALFALSHASQQGKPFDLVLMDWKMPGMDGIEAVRRIKADLMLTRIPAVLMVSAFEREEVMGRAESVAVDGFILKPVEQSLLFDTIVRIFGVERGSHPAELRLLSVHNHAMLAGRRVLLVEDNEFNRDLASELLANLGISVTIAPDGREGVSRVLTETFDLVLMDIQMPVMDGLTATRLIRAEARLHSLPIIAMTAHAMGGDRERSLDAGMNDHLTKPISPDMLTEALIRWMPARTVALPEQEMAAAKQVITEPGLPDHLPPFDIEAALLRANGKARLLRRLMHSFCDQFANAGSDLRALLTAGRRPDAERLAHSLKGIAATLEATVLAKAATAVEQALRTGRDENLSSLIDAMDSALAPAIAAAGSLQTPVL